MAEFATRECIIPFLKPFDVMETGCCTCGDRKVHNFKTVPAQTLCFLVFQPAVCALNWSPQMESRL